MGDDLNWDIYGQNLGEELRSIILSIKLAAGKANKNL